MPTIIDLTSLGSAGFVIRGEAEFDLAGWSVSSAGDVNGDGFDDVIVGAIGGDYGGNSSGEAFVLFGKRSGFGPIDLGNLAAIDGFAIGGSTSFDQAGWSVSSVGDINGDGFDDLIVGAPYAYDSVNQREGEAYVLFGKASGFGTIDLGNLAAADGFTIHADETGDHAGFSVSGGGDINGDGFDDIIVGAPHAGDDQYVGGADHGEAYVIFGKASGLADVEITTLVPEDPNHDPAIGFLMRHGDDATGHSVSNAGDINNDGYDDIIVGAPFGGGFSGGGISYVLFGKAGSFATIELGELEAEDGFLIRGPSGYSGWTVSGAGDVNGDGFDDMIVGAPYAFGAGRAYVVFGKASGFAEVDLANLGAAGFAIHADARGDRAGISVSGAGDVNGDGFDDVIVGAFLNDDGGTSAGAAYVVFGKAAAFATVQLSNLDPAAGFIIQDDAGDAMGQSVSAAGDVNGDGFADIIVGARYGDDNGSNAGEAYVIFGMYPTTAVTRIGSAADQTIRGGAFADTLRGLGGNDLLFGNHGNDILEGGAGDDVLRGGFGADTMRGGAGDDVYSVASGGDRAIETSAADGTDLVQSSVNFTLGAHVENLTLTGAAAISGTGNSLANILTGNSAANWLNGGGGNDRLDGGGGNDTMLGGDGNDTYVVDQHGDQAAEGRGGGNDRVISSFSYTLGSDLEHLTLGGSGAINGFGNGSGNSMSGNDADNRLSGHAGNDRLYGQGGDDVLAGGADDDNLNGGAGNDRLDGFGGRDGYYFDAALDEATNVDEITDFSVVYDSIFLDRAIFTGIAADGTLAPGAFRAGTAAADANDRILYDAATGEIRYDPDGNGAQAAILFAEVGAGTALTHADFVGYI